MKRLSAENAVNPRCTGTMKKKAKLTMSSLALTLLCCCSCMLALVGGLPITSKPLDNSPDHLTWQAAWLSGDSRISGAGGKAKKIPKSIFIAPQLNGYNGSLCPPDSKIDFNGKCIQVININTADILLTKIQSILGNTGGTPNTGGEDDYDYYDSSGPYQVNLPLSIDLPVEKPAQPPKPVDHFYGAASLVDNSPVEEKPIAVEQTFLGGSSKKTVDQTAAESNTDIAFLAFESLPNGSLSTQLELDGNNRTVVQQIVITSTPAVPITATIGTTDTDYNIPGSTSTVASSSTDATTSAHVTTVTTEDPRTSTTDMVSTIDSAKPTEFLIGTTNEDDRPNSYAFATTTEHTLNDPTDELSGLKSELMEESLMLEPHSSSTTEMPSTMPEVDSESYASSTKIRPTEPHTRTTAPSETTTTKVMIHTIAHFPSESSRATANPVQIVTPITINWNSPLGATAFPLPAASQTQQERTTRATPETTPTVSVDRSTDSPFLVMKDTAVDKKNSETVHRQEMRDNLRESMDANNRFVYHHLSASSSTSVTPQSHDYTDQLKKINEIVAENKHRHQQLGGSRIRFPTLDEDQAPAAATSNLVRFPGAVSHRVVPNVNHLPDIFPKKTSDSTTTRPPFWWLPSGWEVDQTGQKPMLLRFWSRMPLVRDQSLTTSSTSSNPSSRWRSSSVTAAGSSTSPSLSAPRGNSKSPSENFYKEVSSQDIYKVLNMHQLKHKR
ncbi:mucin-2-like isoform X2 [Toxorhynchites rutilus septentrionalis]|uniref:mucin-2-like isoform X2 n=1 Tax=Toxorhynchites rutilus septentrionalis TaxID=329112 RepID=UPI00247AE813|nr:mucin-2-like isoform X2 [Toxorhynchites rutilus septentrionalis]XP_055628192.1 mucin-2-like isoform X2 [Toxorhynchites rutilus septentrionalis]XP_055628193.1 mucin-2-like isoform X2 [Toxorhynchites rutilus septentrionalis]XP_055628194.1 mucin-2-like isoform X2 [Toxorhynchites rutilus septentrionalis]XP_055628196.1 mucin-2-like isoform X2 [Toxorhynchites rutilus septentrionalis]XP_055628197.1 mucin-2-like isoform X2 [Toxorhynchites rutilus septentrionalis]XP_055628198.1 mucin-2-like isoform